MYALNVDCNPTFTSSVKKIIIRARQVLEGHVNAAKMGKWKNVKK